MKVKEYVFEITTTKEVKIKIPEVFLNKELIDDWESGLWTLEGNTLEEKVQSIAQYAAEMESGGCGNYQNDGIGALFSYYHKIDRGKNKHAIQVQETYEDVETHLVKKGEWKNE